MEGKKLDAGKPRWSLFPAGTLRKVLDVLEFGARKYDVDNWKHVPDAKRRYYDAAMRHIDAWWNGEQADQETGVHHLAHATCCLLFLLALDDTEAEVDVDDSKAFKDSLTATVEMPVEPSWTPWMPLSAYPATAYGARMAPCWEVEYRDAEGDLVTFSENPVDFRRRRKPKP